MPKIKSIAFDLGGVLFKEGKSVAIKNLSKKYNYNEKVILNILKSPKSTELRKGLIPDNKFWSWAQENLPRGYNAEIVKKEWYDGYILDEGILDLAKKLKEKYKLIIFSGNIKSRVEYLDKKYHFRKYFDLEIYSYDYQLNKPLKKFVDILIKKSGTKPEEIIYIDDIEEFIKPAKELGINTIIYKTDGIKDLEKKLNNLGVKL